LAIFETDGKMRLTALFAFRTFRTLAATHHFKAGHLRVKLGANMGLTESSLLAKGIVLDGTHFLGAGLGIVKVSKVWIRGSHHLGLAIRAG